MFYHILQLLMKIPVLQHLRIIFYFWDKLTLLFIPARKNNLGNRKKILFVFPIALGDCIIFLGTVPHIRKLYPPEAYQIELICQDGYSALFADYFDSIREFDFHKASVNPVYRFMLYRELREQRYDTIIDPVGCEVCSPNIFLVNAACANHKIGFLPQDIQNRQCPRWLYNRIYTRIYEIDDRHLHKLQFYTDEINQLGNFCFSPQLAEISAFPLTRRLPEDYFIIYPSASIEAKRWPLERFAFIARKIYLKTGFTLVLCGTENDMPVLEKFISIIPEVPVCNMAGITSVAEYIEIVGHAKLLVTNDTSAYHIAVAQKIKVCIIAGGYVYDSFIKYPDNIIAPHMLKIVCTSRPCFNCNNKCRYKFLKTYPCILDNTVEDAWNAVLQLLEEEIC